MLDRSPRSALPTRRWIGAVSLLATMAWMGACARHDGPAPITDSAVAAADPQSHLFAEIDTTLALAIAQSQLAALMATDPALRAFAAQRGARYAALRGRLQLVAERAGATPALAVIDDSLRAATAALATLRQRRGAQFDRLYLQQARSVQRELVEALDAAVRVVHDRELREALRRAGMAAKGAATPAAPARGSVLA
jgi:hypothetical protein